MGFWKRLKFGELVEVGVAGGTEREDGVIADGLSALEGVKDLFAFYFHEVLGLVVQDVEEHDDGVLIIATLAQYRTVVKSKRIFIFAGIHSGNRFNFPPTLTLTPAPPLIPPPNSLVPNPNPRLQHLHKP